eukprot:scaffold74327_cov18-Tisochrysis_lutea.AAC.1
MPKSVVCSRWSQGHIRGNNPALPAPAVRRIPSLLPAGLTRGCWAGIASREKFSYAVLLLLRTAGGAMVSACS